ncbi:putative Phage integrase [Burkholderia pseudomallei]|nr:putative Phage integrase [Burkholderia pseudomallei]
MLNHTTLKTSVRNGFTVSNELDKWAVLRGATPDDAQLILSSKNLSIVANDATVDRLADVEYLRVIVERIVTCGDKRLNKSAILGLLIDLNLVLAPMIAPFAEKSKLSGKGFGNGLEDFMSRWEAKYESLMSSESRPVFVRLYCSTVEGKNLIISESVIVKWVMAYARSASDDIRRTRWVTGLHYRIAEGLQFIAQRLGMPISHTKQTHATQMRAQLEHNQAFQHLQQKFDQWLSERQLASVSKHRTAFSHLTKFLYLHQDLLTSQGLFSQLARQYSLFDFISKNGAPTYHQAFMIRHIHNFLEWYSLDQPGVAGIDTLTDQIVLEPGLCWPFTTTQLAKVSDICSQKNDRVTSPHLALSLEHLLQIELLLTENDMAWPKKQKQDWIQWKNPQTGNNESVFCPVLTNLIRLMIKLPIRQVQARRLDSGEGDEFRYEIATRQWVKNTTKHGGYWKSHGAKNQFRGVLRFVRDSLTGANFCGFYINSDKGSDRKVGFDERSGYQIDWENEDAIRIVDEMASWQEKYNPVEGPLSFKDLRRDVFGEASEKVASSKMSAFYLFRYPGGIYGGWNESPPSGQQLRAFWLEILAELEARLAKDNPNAPKFITTWQGNTPAASPYTLHGMRVGGVTRLARAGASPWIIMHVTNHKSYAMMVGYVQPKPTEISIELERANARALANKQEEFKNFLSTGTLEQVHRISVARGAEAYAALGQIREIGGRGALRDDGVCLNCQTRCEEGLLDESPETPNPETARRAKPVPVLPDGSRDCSQCSFDITGAPFLLGMQIKINQTGLWIQSGSERKQSLLRAIDELSREQLKRQRAQMPPDVQIGLKISRLTGELNMQSEYLTSLAVSMDAQGKRFESVRKLLNTVAKSERPLLLGASQSTGKFAWSVEPRFAALHAVCRGAKWFTSIDTRELSRERTELIVRAFARQDLKVPVSLLSNTESQAAADAWGDFMLSMLSPTSVQALVEGRTTFEKLGIRSRVMALVATEPNSQNGNAVEAGAVTFVA